MNWKFWKKTPKQSGLSGQVYKDLERQLAESNLTESEKQIARFWAVMAKGTGGEYHGQ